MLDWLKANAESHKIERWFFFVTWKDIVNVDGDGYMGIILFDGPNRGAALNCLGQVYRASALGGPRLECDASWTGCSRLSQGVCRRLCRTLPYSVSGGGYWSAELRYRSV